MKTTIVSNRRREVIVLKNRTFIYIPLTAKEAREFAPNVIIPCWRIEYTT